MDAPVRSLHRHEARPDRDAQAAHGIESGLFDQTRAQINGAASSLLRSAADAGEIRDDIGAADLIRSIGGICMANDQIGNLEDAARLVDLVFDGLRYGAPATR